MAIMEIHKIGASLDSVSSKDEQQSILSLLDEGKDVILDLSGCSYVSSAGLRVMLYSYKVATANGLKLYLVGVSKEVREVMSITGFEHFFQYFNTVEECKKQVSCKE